MARHFRRLQPVARQANWDLLRSISMFAVVVVHTAGGAVSTAAILCDPIFFALSGYFGIREPKHGLRRYYLSRFTTVVLPLFVYSIVLYLRRDLVAGVSPAGYIAYFAHLMDPWWFIPALIPFLILAPFLARLFGNLEDHQVILIARIASLMALWGIASSILGWVASASDHITWQGLVQIATRLVPASIIPGAGYFIYFCLGYFFRRLREILIPRQKCRLVALGLAMWALDVAFAVIGIPRSDPSHPWLFATFAVFLIFDEIRIENNAARRAIEWVARRSYTIYLLQYTAIALVQPLFPSILSADGSPFGWIPICISAWALSLAAASIIDPTLLRLAQQGAVRLALAVPAPKRKRDRA